MSMQKPPMPFKAPKNSGAIMFGVILLLIGLVASFYDAGYNSAYYPYERISLYPYQTIGIILTVVGIVFVGLGLFYSPRKTELPPPP